jgi:hypothetical protein
MHRHEESGVTHRHAAPGAVTRTEYTSRQQPALAPADSFSSEGMPLEASLWQAARRPPPAGPMPWHGASLVSAPWSPQLQRRQSLRHSLQQSLRRPRCVVASHLYGAYPE